MNKPDPTKALYAEAIRQNIANKDWVKLAEAMIGAEKVGAIKALRARGWYHVGLYEAERANHPAAIIAFNSARVLSSKPESSLSNMLDELQAFSNDFDGIFSRKDLYLLEQALDRLTSFITIHQKASKDLVSRSTGLAKWIELRIQSAPLKEETPASHHVERIFASLYPPMTIEEVHAEFARIVEPLIRERLERKAKAASGGGGRGPKDPEDTDKAESKEDPPIETGGDEHKGESPQSGS